MVDSHLLVEVIEVFLAGLVVGSGRHGRGTRLHGCRVGRLIHVCQQHRLRKEGLVVLPRAAVAMTARPYFEVEGAVNPAIPEHSHIHGSMSAKYFFDPWAPRRQARPPSPGVEARKEMLRVVR